MEQGRGVILTENNPVSNTIVGKRVKRKARGLVFIGDTKMVVLLTIPDSMMRTLRRSRVYYLEGACRAPASYVK